METIILGGGCFWCLDAVYRRIRGIINVTSGYSGGHTVDPTMDEVYKGNTGHAEVVKIEYDTKTISLKEILDVFWTIHDPTTVNRQGNDIGDEYRSIIFYTSAKQREVISTSIEKAKKLWGDNIVTQVVEFDKFYSAGNDQQDFFDRHPELAYCQIIINPKLKKLREKFSGMLK